MKKDLAKWSPNYLKTLYALELDKFTSGDFSEKQKQVLVKRIDALYRLGSHPDMREVWNRLLKKDLIRSKHKVDKGLLATNTPADNEHLLIGGIHELIWLNSFGVKQLTPSQKEKQLGEISKKIKELQKLIRRSGEAHYENLVSFENFLHRKNIDYRNQMGEEVEPTSFHNITLINGNLGTELSTLSFGESQPWLKRTQAQRLGWWAKEVGEVSLTDVLDYYSERLGGYSNLYKKHYGRFQPLLIRGLVVLMKDLYGSPLEEYVGRIASTILNKDISKDYVRGYKK
jgi:hypothetical protein